MSNLVKWAVNAWGMLERKEYSRETEHFYMHVRGRGRDSKVCLYYRYFDTEAEAIEHIRRRAENKLEQKRVDRIKSAGVELLEALETLMARLDPYDYPNERGAARAAIAKARGEE
jgi:hypothetical protein